MNVTLLRIDASDCGQSTPGERIVKVLIEVDGMPEWHEVRIRADYLPGTDAGLLVAGQSLRNRLAGEPQAMYRICKLAGRELRGQAIALPELVAA